MARMFAAEGARVIVTARRVEKLEALAAEIGHDAVVIGCDLSAPDGAAKLAAELERRGLSPDLLINNAGVGLYGPFAAQDRERALAMLRLNVNALTELSHRLLPAMLERKRGGILNVASTASFQAGPKMAVYFATKAYVLSFSEAMHHELKGSGVAVSCLCPGPTITEFAGTAGVTETFLFKTFARSIDSVARAGIRGVRRNKAVVVPGFMNKLGVFWTRLLPRWVVRRIVSAIQ